MFVNYIYWIFLRFRRVILWTTGRGGKSFSVRGNCPSNMKFWLISCFEQVDRFFKAQQRLKKKKRKKSVYDSYFLPWIHYKLWKMLECRAGVAKTHGYDLIYYTFLLCKYTWKVTTQWNMQTHFMKKIWGSSIQIFRQIMTRCLSRCTFPSVWI